nr:MAG TPA: hypothetical protein [Caudoviricetes sp.]
MTDREIKIQAYRDFADRLRTRKRTVKALDFCTEFWSSAVLIEDIENTLIEMISEEE